MGSELQIGGFFFKSNGVSFDRAVINLLVLVCLRAD